MWNPTLLLVLLATIFAASGCVSLAPQEDTVRSYALGLDVNSTSAARIDSLKEDTPLYHVARPELPAYALGGNMRYQTTDGQIIKIDNSRWAEDVAESISRKFAQAIGTNGGTAAPSFYPWPQLARRMQIIDLSFTRFGANEDGTIDVHAIWQVKSGDSVLRSGSYQSSGISWKVGDPASYVAGLNAAIDILAQAVASNAP